MWKNKKFSMVVSLLIAIALWVFVIGTMDPTTTKTFQDVDVEFIHLEELSDQGLAIADSSVKTINVTAQGNKSVMDETDKSDVTATIDVKHLVLGENKCRILTDVSGKATVKNQSTTVAYVTVETVTSSDKEIAVVFSDESKTKEEPTAISQSMDTVKVKGTTSVIDKVDHVNAIIPAAEVTKHPSVLDAALVAVDKNGNKVSNAVVSVASIKVEAVLYKTKAVSLSVQVRGQGEKKVEKPENVIVKGPSALLDNLSKITADEVNIAGVTKNTELKLNLHLPEGVYVASSSKPTILKVVVTESHEEGDEPEVAEDDQENTEE